MIKSQKEAVYKEMLAELNEDKKHIDWQINWIKNKLAAERAMLRPEVLLEEDMEEEWEAERIRKAATKKLPRKKNPAPQAVNTHSGGLTDMVETILTEAEKPLHATAILTELQKRGRTTTTIKSLTGSMPQDSRKRFENLGRNIWTLSVWSNELKDAYRPPTSGGKYGLLYN